MQFLVKWLYVVLLIALLFSCVVLYKLISTFGLILEFEFSGSLKAANLACSATLTHCVVAIIFAAQVIGVRSNIE